MVKEIRVNATKIEFEDDELGAVRTLKQLSDGTYITRLLSKVLVQTRDLTAISGDVSYTGVDFSPTSIQCIANVDGATFPYSTSFTDSAKTSRCTYLHNDGTHYSTVTAVQASHAAGLQSAIVKSYGINGFTLTWTKTGSPTGTLMLVFLCFR